MSLILDSPSNGIHWAETTWEKKGRIETASGSTFGVVDCAVWRRKVIMVEGEGRGPSRKTAYVSLSRGITINLGNFESVRLDEGVIMPCSATENDVTATRNRLRERVEQNLDDERVRVTGTTEEKALLVEAKRLPLGDFPPVDQARITALIEEKKSKEDKEAPPTPIVVEVASGGESNNG